jgi:hypothetical protein
MRNAAPTFAVTAILLSLAGLEAATADNHSFAMPGLRQAVKTATSSRRDIHRHPTAPERQLGGGSDRKQGGPGRLTGTIFSGPNIGTL